MGALPDAGAAHRAARASDDPSAEHADDGHRPNASITPS
ncbi:Hypothetical protein A7982_01876 [Minicystis rosea]|nr:Hypothetical protein A7982_01876 [Minicystis rosea]